MLSSGIRKEKEWVLRAEFLRTYTPAIRRLYATLRRELSPEYFELLPYETLPFELMKWSDNGCWFIDSYLHPLLKKTSHAFRMQIRGVKASMSALHLGVYFEEQGEAAQFHKLEAAVESGLQSYGLEYQKQKFVSLPFVRFKTTNSHQHLPSLERWEECDFGSLQLNSWRIEIKNECYYTFPLNRFICHRGNLSQKVLEDENKPEILDKRIAEGYDVELDVWVRDGEYSLGHDEPQYEVSWEWLMQHPSRKLIHCKNGETLEHMILRAGKEGYSPNLFYHTNEHYAVSTRGSIIVLPGQRILSGSVNMMPEMSPSKRPEEERRAAFAVCSDSLSFLKQ